MKTAIITGASRGIGRTLALRMAATGYRVINIARNADDLAQLEDEIQVAGGQAESLPMDITDEEKVKQSVADIIGRYGQVEVLVNNAGFGIFKQAAEINGEEWSRLMEVNVKGTFLLTSALIPHMQSAGGGHIIGIASDISKRTFPGGSLYCASKYAQDAFLSALRKEVRKDNIKVSVIYPGLVDTHFHGATEGAERQAEYLKPVDIANAVLYIADAPAHVVVDELMIHPISQEY